jgi:hypothetical protein
MMTSENTILPGLKWVSGYKIGVSRMIRTHACRSLWGFFTLSPPDFIPEPGHFEDFDFRYMLVDEEDQAFFSGFASWLLSCVSAGYSLMMLLDLISSL